MIKKIISGKLRTVTGLYIGSGSAGKVTDALVYRNIDGEVIIPGTALAGSFRALATRLAPHLGYTKCTALKKDKSPLKFCSCPVCSLFGSINPGNTENEGKPSKIWFYDAVLKNDVKTVIRDGVGIDRETNTSSKAARAKYDFEIIPKDAVFSFRFELNDKLSKEEEEILMAVLAEWQRGRGYLGGNKARGLGNIELTEINVHRLDLSEKEDLMMFLQSDDPLEAAVEENNWLTSGIDSNTRKLNESIKKDDCLYNSFAQLDFILKFSGGFVINDALGSIQTGFDLCPRLENGNFIIPGSSLRGVIRSHAEKIARTLATIDSTKDNFLNKCPACNPFADLNTPLTSCSNLFRKYKQEKRNEEVKISEAKLCLACRLFGCSDLGSRLFISDGYLINAPEIKLMDFLAIDRFTGGGKEGSKFDALLLWQPSFKIRIFMENFEEWSLGWLMLVLKDLKDGLISFGGGKNKWFGKATTEKEEIKIGVVAEEFLPKGLKITGSKEGSFLVQTYALNSLIQDAHSTIDRWIAEFHIVLSNFKRQENFSLQSDTYFQSDLEKVYPKEVPL